MNIGRCFQSGVMVSYRNVLNHDTRLKERKCGV